MKKLLLSIYFSATTALLMAQSSSAKKGSISQGLTDATEEVRSVFDSAVSLLYVVCALMAIIGAFHVYSKWTSGDPDVTKAAAGWIGGLIFVGVAITIIESVFL